MAEEKAANWQKWEGPGKPPGEGVVTTPEMSQPQDVEGRGQKKSAVVVCPNCGVGFYSIPDTCKWFTCWKCGALVYNTNV